MNELAFNKVLSQMQEKAEKFEDVKLNGNKVNVICKLGSSMFVLEFDTKRFKFGWSIGGYPISTPVEHFEAYLEHVKKCLHFMDEFLSRYNKEMENGY